LNSRISNLFQSSPDQSGLEKVFSPHVERDGVFLQKDFEFAGVAHEEGTIH
jgi:hypothetical protein